MLVTSSRHTASTCRKLIAAACTSVFLLAVGSAPAAASTETAAAPAPEANPASATTDQELAVCPGQAFSQPFVELGDSNYYTLVEGSTFDQGSAGWTLAGGAKVIEAARPDGSQGATLELPAGSVAVSPPVCVTLQYPTARTWAESQGGGSLRLAVVYSLAAPKLSTAAAAIGAIPASPNAGWQLSAPFELNPQLAGAEEGVRSARFVYTAAGRRAEFRVFGLYVDPRFGP